MPAARTTKPKKAPKNKGGRPRKTISVGELEQLAQLACTQEEAAQFFSVTRQTLISRLKEPEYAEAWERGYSKARISLRRNQMQLSKTNASMAIFLGKNLLNQTDKQEMEHSGKNGGPIFLWGTKPE